jgi:hypothetical protein
VLVLLLVDGAARVPELRVAGHRPGGHRRHERRRGRDGDDHRLVEDDEVAGEAAAAAAGPGLEEDAGAVA